jgi:hypothetical protein
MVEFQLVMENNDNDRTLSRYKVTELYLQQILDELKEKIHQFNLMNVKDDNQHLMKHFNTFRTEIVKNLLEVRKQIINSESMVPEITQNDQHQYRRKIKLPEIKLQNSMEMIPNGSNFVTPIIH